MDLSPIVTHLKAELTGVRQVGGAADLEAAAAGTLAAPACFVMPHSEQVTDEDMDGDGLLRVVFAVVLVVANRRDITGGAALADLDALRRAVRTALGSLLLPDAQVAPRFSSGSLVQFSDGQMMWADEFVVFLVDF